MAGLPASRSELSALVDSTHWFAAVPDADGWPGPEDERALRLALALQALLDEQATSSQLDNSTLASSQLDAMCEHFRNRGLAVVGGGGGDAWHATTQRAHDLAFCLGLVALHVDRGLAAPKLLAEVWSAFGVGGWPWGLDTGGQTLLVLGAP